MGLNPADGVPTLEQMSSEVPPTTTSPTSESQGEGIQEENPTVSLESKPNPGNPEEASKAEEPKEKGETPSTDAQKQVQEIIEGWKEDRMLLDKTTKENRELKDSLRDLKSRLSRYESSENEEGEEGDKNLSEKEIIERYEAKKNEEIETQRAEVAREISFLERTDPYFKEHKQAILKTAADFNASNLNQAIKIHKAQRAVAEKSKQAQSQSKPLVNTPKYNPETDSKLSIRDIYLRGRGV